MRLNQFFLAVLCMTIINCNGQEKSVAEKTIYNKKDNIAGHFSQLDKLYYDPENKIVYSTKLFPNVGKFTIYYSPKKPEDIQYFKDFEKLNNITKIFDELHSQYYYTSSTQEKINLILKEKTKNETDFSLFGTFIHKNYIDIDNQEEYSIAYPFIEKYYKKDKGNWIYLYEKVIQNYHEEQKLNNIQEINLLNGSLEQKSMAILDGYLNNPQYFIKTFDVNKDGIVDKIISHQKYEGNELFIFLGDTDGNFNLNLKSTNFSEDGGNQVDDIKETKEGFEIVTKFPDRGHLQYNYFITANDEKFILKKITSESYSWQNQSTEYCVKNINFTLTNSQEELINKIAEASKECTTKTQ